MCLSLSSSLQKLRISDNYRYILVVTVLHKVNGFNIKIIHFTIILTPRRVQHPHRMMCLIHKCTMDNCIGVQITPKMDLLKVHT